MEWLSQNWIWLALAGGAFWFFSRGKHGGMMGGCCGHRAAHNGPPQDDGTQGTDAENPPIRAQEAAQGSNRMTSNHRHRHGGCC